MADSKITDLTAITAVTDTTEFAANVGGADRKVSGLQLRDYFGDSIQNQSVASQAVTAATLTYIAGSALAVPVAGLRVGTWFRWRMYLTKTAAGTAASTWHVRLGTAGTTADTAILTFTQTGLGTAVADTGYVDILAVIRGPITSSCIAVGTCVLGHDLQITGFSVRPNVIVQSTSAAFNATTASLIVGVTQTSGASQAFTYQQVVAEAKQL